MKLLWLFAVILRHSFGDELVSSVIHGIGIVLSMTRLAMLVAFTAPHGNALTVVACAGFSSLLVSLYSASMLDHSISIAAAKPDLRALEHIAIHVLIARTRTPFTLIASPGVWGRMLFAAVWTFALADSGLKLRLFQRYHRLLVLLYVGTG